MVSAGSGRVSKPGFRTLVGSLFSGSLANKLG